MSKISTLVFSIQSDLLDGKETFEAIAIKHGVPQAWVEEVSQELIAQEVEYEGDFDDAYAFASAGFGTDEDYGYHAEDF